MMMVSSLSSAAAAPSARGSSAVSCSGRAAFSTMTLIARSSPHHLSTTTTRRRSQTAPRRSLQHCRAANMPGGVPDPEALKAAMADPAVQEQVAAMSAAMQNEKVQKRFEELRVRT